MPKEPTAFTIASWNVNSIRVRMPHILKWLDEHQPKALVLQETKTEDATFPEAAIREAGYHVHFTGEKKYNGVAILSKEAPEDVVFGIPNFPDPQKRVLAATVAGIRIINVYIPNGQSLDSDKYTYKLEWLDGLIQYVGAALKDYPALVLLGDFNIAPADLDVYNPKIWRDRVLVSPPERDRFQALLSEDLVDALRLHHPEEAIYSWWDYRAGSRYKSRGLRIDHMLISAALKDRCKDAQVDSDPRGWERPSDHGVVFGTFE